MPRIKDLRNNQYGRLTVIRPMEYRSHKGSIVWECKCACGNMCYVDSGNLISGNTQSCGCYRLERLKTKITKHGMKNKRVYDIWVLMRDRCNNPNSKSYVHYGGRGIKVCDEWNDFITFYNDMGEPRITDTIERINVNGNYEKSNCIWIPKNKQGRNRTVNKILSYNGVSKCLAEWSDITGINYYTLHKRLRCGWSIQDTLSIPTLKPGEKIHGIRRVSKNKAT